MHFHLALRLDASSDSEPEPEGGGLAVLEPETAPPGGSGTGGSYRVILYDDDWHSPEDVLEQLVKATGCSPRKAIAIINEVEAKGRAVCLKGDREKCHDAARILREIRLQCEVDCD
jgi:ATP-dependent Clp protease adaptor protein ClpS